MPQSCEESSFGYHSASVPTGDHVCMTTTLTTMATTTGSDKVVYLQPSACRLHSQLPVASTGSVSCYTEGKYHKVNTSDL